MRAKGSRLVFYFSIVTALALVVAACGKSRGGRGASVAAPAAAAMPAITSEPAPERKLPPLPVRELSPELRDARTRAMADASRLRGLAWRGEVGMTPLTGWEYGTRTKEVAETLASEDLQALSRLAAAGGILPEGTDLAALAASFTAASAGATYSPPDKQVLLLSENPKSLSPKNHSLLTHEFTHALQDQHFDLLSMLLVRPYNFDRAEAAFALVEGDAMNVQRRLEGGDAYARRTLEDIARSEDARFDTYRRQIGWLFPPLLTETFIFRYRDGVRFVEAMRRARPARGADELFRRPPASTEQVLHPEKYLADEAPREVGLDEARFLNDGWRLSASTTLGEMGTRGVLLAGASNAQAKRASAGWGGDRACVFARAAHAPLFVWKTVWDSAADAREFYDSYNALKRRTATADATGDSNGAGRAQTLWREAGSTTLVRLEGDAVIVVRGGAEDVSAALETALR